MRFNVRTKLLAGFLAVVAVTVVVGVFAVVKLGEMNDVTDSFSGRTVPAVKSTGDLRAAIAEVRKDQLLLVTLSSEGSDQTAVVAQQKAISDGTRDVQTALAASRRLAAGASAQEKVKAVDAAWNRYLEATASLDQLLAQEDHAGAIALLTSGAGDAAFDEVTAAVTALADEQDARSLAAGRDASGTVDAARTTLTLLVLLGVIVGVALALLLSRWYAGGVRQMLNAAYRLTLGHLDQRIDINTKDELGELAEKFRSIIGFIGMVANDLRNVADGNFDIRTRPTSDGDVLGHAMVEMTDTMRDALGERSCLEALIERMESLRANDLADLEGALAAVGRGDLTVDVTPVTSEIVAAEGRAVGRLAEIFNQMLASTRGSVVGYNQMRETVAQMLKQIADASEAVGAASQQMATTSEESGRAVGEIAGAIGEVAAGAERQVRTVASARSLAEEVVNTTRASDENATLTAKAAEQAREVAEEGATTIAEATEAMQSVRASSQEVTETIRALGEKSDEIGGIVDAISGIAEQTNLLALNAAIEAARAGEQGRGFAVVAEEVRKLAEESQQAARSIGALIAEIQRETGRAVEAVESGAQRTADGVVTVEQAREAFLRISASVEDVSGRVGQIAVAIGEISQSAGRMQEDMSEVAAVAEQSSASTQQVSASTEQTSASTQEIAASAQELAKTAEELERLVGRFQLA